MISSLTEDNFEREVIYGKHPVIVFFYANMYSPCNMMSKIIDEVEKELEQKVWVRKVDVEVNTKISDFYGVMSIPTLIFFRNGIETKRFVGVQRKEIIIETALESLNEQVI